MCLVQESTARFYIFHRHTTPRRTSHTTTTRHCTTLHCTALHCTSLHHTTPHHTTSHHTTFHGHEKHAKTATNNNLPQTQAHTGTHRHTHTHPHTLTPTHPHIRDSEPLGHRGGPVLRSDQEPALVSVLEEVAKMRPDSAQVLEHSLVGDSHGNGDSSKEACAGLRKWSEL